MNKKRFYIVILLIIVVCFKLSAQDCGPDGCPEEGGGTIPIPGILYFLAALIGVGLKKLYNDRKKS